MPALLLIVMLFQLTATVAVIGGGKAYAASHPNLPPVPITQIQETGSGPMIKEEQ